MKRMAMALAMAAAAAMVGCGGKDSGGSTSSSGSTGATGTVLPTSGGSTGAGTTSAGTSGTTSGGTTGTGSTTGAATTGTSGSSGSTGFQVAAHDPFPQVPNVTGGPTLHHLQLVTITFNGYANQSAVEAFGDWIVGSDWLTEVGADYDIHTGTQVAKVHLTDAAPQTISDNQIQAYLQSKIADGTLPAPGQPIAGSSDTLTEPLYTIYYPDSTTIDLGDGSTSCSAFGGYHNFFNYQPTSGAATPVSYAVLPTCHAQWSGGSDMDMLTVAASHELIEAASDPFPYTGVGNDTTSSYVLDDFSSPWAFIPGEIGDLCVEQNWTDPTSHYRVQRVWSNSAAAASPGQSPCIPAPDSPFFSVSTDLAATQVFPAGQSVTYKVTAWSDRPYPAGKWFVGVSTYQNSFNPTFTLTTADGQSIDQTSQGYVSMGNGDTATLTVTIPSGTTGQSCGGYCYASLILVSASGTSNAFTMWPIAVIPQ